MTEFADIVAAAEAAGMAAGTACTPTPMIVGKAVGLFGNAIVPGTEEYVADGVCGFAYIKFKGNTAFGRYMKKVGKARPDYPTGLYVSVPYFNQSMQRKEAYARAYCKVLRDNGIADAYPESRMD